MADFVHAFISLLAPFFFFWLQASMAYTAMSVKLDRNERRLSNLPFLALLAYCFLLVIYARLEHEMALFIVNLIGIVTGIYATATYHLYSLYAPEPRAYYAVAVVIIAAMVLSSMGLTGVVGALAMLSAVAMYCAPLATLPQVLEDHSTRSLSFPICAFTFLTAVSWTLYSGVVAKQLSLLLPNIVGVVVSSAQLCLFMVYGFDDTPSYSSLPLGASTTQRFGLRPTGVSVEPAAISKALAAVTSLRAESKEESKETLSSYQHA